MSIVALGDEFYWFVVFTVPILKVKIEAFLIK